MKMISLLKNDPRGVYDYLNYKHAVQPDPFKKYGPTHGEDPVTLYAVSISEDGKRVGFSMQSPTDVVDG